MKWRFVFRFIPVPVFYSDSMPLGVGGQTFPWRGPCVRIRPQYAGDEGIHQHELAHIEVWWATLGLIALVSMFSEAVQVWNEARAYRVQMQYPDAAGHYLTLDEAAARLANPWYGFGLTYEAARRKLSQ